MARPKNVTIRLSTKQRDELKRLTGEDHAEVMFESVKTYSSGKIASKATLGSKTAPRKGAFKDIAKKHLVGKAAPAKKIGKAAMLSKAAPTKKIGKAAMLSKAAPTKKIGKAAMMSKAAPTKKINQW